MRQSFLTTIGYTREVLMGVVRSPVIVEYHPRLEHVRIALANCMGLFTEQNVGMFLEFFGLMLSYSR